MPLGRSRFSRCDDDEGHDNNDDDEHDGDEGDYYDCRYPGGAVQHAGSYSRNRAGQVSQAFVFELVCTLCGLLE